MSVFAVLCVAGKSTALATMTPMSLSSRSRVGTLVLFQRFGFGENALDSRFVIGIYRRSTIAKQASKSRHDESELVFDAEGRVVAVQMAHSHLRGFEDFAAMR